MMRRGSVKRGQTSLPLSESGPNFPAELIKEIDMLILGSNPFLMGRDVSAGCSNGK